MAIAVRTDSFIAPTITQQSLFDGIKQAFANAGYPAPFDDFTSGTDRIVIFAIVTDASKIYGTAYLRIRLTSGLIIGQQLFATWNTSNKTGTGNTTEITYAAFSNSSQVNFVSLNANPEFRFIVTFQGTIVIMLGSLSPANRPNWWDLDAWTYAFIPTGTNFAIFRGTTFNPYATTENDTSLNAGRMINANAQTNRRDILPGIIFYTQSNQGISGRTSDDLVMCAAGGATRFDIIQIPGDTKQYLLLNPATGGLAVRIS